MTDVVIFFFFSSRRRHTRLQGDWSSDVCSSDLRAWPMETRAAIGKVSVQGSGEISLANIDIWTEDGQVATTDSTGKFSFTNLRPGRHAFRVDPRSIPEGYQVAGEEVQLVEASGWTTPRVSFRLLAGGAAHAARIRQPRAPSGTRCALRRFDAP